FVGAYGCNEIPPAKRPYGEPPPVAPRADYDANLMRNFMHADWTNGMPDHWSFGASGAPAGEYSFLSPMQDNATAEIAVEQRWTKPDAGTDPMALFGQTVPDLKPDTYYHLYVAAANNLKNDAVVSVWEVNNYIPGQAASGEIGDVLDERVITLPAQNEVTMYAGTFKTRESSVVRIAVWVDGAENFDANDFVLWWRWILNEHKPPAGTNSNQGE
ncbi:MAG: hypothetical protein KJ052_21205, partial [Candidatus Hydrogenedentes bacterium]|nr:hypothetical protein [Candidatus Hydrogenedentota bacterium]